VQHSWQLVARRHRHERCKLLERVCELRHRHCVQAAWGWPFEGVLVSTAGVDGLQSGTQ
jgi:hypothetical protein